MIPRTAEILQCPAWQSELSRAISDPLELLAILGLDHHPDVATTTQTRDFPLRVPRGYVARMRHGDPEDPLLRQVLPRHAEYLRIPGYGLDPVGDDTAQAATGVLHKYRGRALLVATGACAIHCRYCFRRHFPYAEANARSQGWQEPLEYLRAHTDINEVILSGGDPLVLPDRQLAHLATALDAVPHIKRLRIHSRLPVVLPERIDASLLNWLGTTRLQTVMVIHANHAHEIDTSVRAATEKLRQAGVTLLNQSVLLSGVNDSAGALIELSESLFAVGVLPYYLHVLDKVQGAAHFDLSRDRATQLHQQMQANLPGYLVPRLVMERPGDAHKLWLPG